MGRSWPSLRPCRWQVGEQSWPEIHREVPVAAVKEKSPSAGILT
jgi:hypothetical protein